MFEVEYLLKVKQIVCLIAPHNTAGIGWGKNLGGFKNLWRVSEIYFESGFGFRVEKSQCFEYPSKAYPC